MVKEWKRGMVRENGGKRDNRRIKQVPTFATNDWLGEQSLRRPPLRGQRLSVRHREVLIRWRLTASLVRGLSFSWTARRCPSLARKAGRWRGPGTRSAAATLDACRALLADHLSYGDRWGNPPAGA
ncbi:unnamed protein product [Pleuronectes platessa]|uniref:Uncharacterized protein n=1 Tax=Pleuronectes platessa TaxID=8262 RepID=A0A9N7VGV1_PLEPL|nr:unnamed protein product [Pleuronectes platessa]